MYYIVFNINLKRVVILQNGAFWNVKFESCLKYNSTIFTSYLFNNTFKFTFFHFHQVFLVMKNLFTCFLQMPPEFISQLINRLQRFSRVQLVFLKYCHKDLLISSLRFGKLVWRYLAQWISPAQRTRYSL